MSAGVLILGAGQAAAQLAISLRHGGYAGPIRMVGDEPYAPYQRPPLSKAFLKARPAVDTLLLRREGFWADQKVALDLGTPAAAVEPVQKRVTLRDGRSFDYETLVFATGTRARDMPVPGIGLAGVFSLRKIDDVRRLRPALDAARRVVIVGGGYIGLEVAAVMRQEDREAIVVEAEDRVMKRVTGETVSGFYDALHRGRGVDLRLGARLAAIEGAEPRHRHCACFGRAHRRRSCAGGNRRARQRRSGRRRRIWLARTASWSTISPPPRRVSMPSAIARGSTRTAMAARSASNACRMPSTRPRPQPPPSWASPCATIRCRGSGRISTR